LKCAKAKASARSEKQKPGGSIINSRGLVLARGRAQGDATEKAADGHGKKSNGEIGVDLGKEGSEHRRHGWELSTDETSAHVVQNETRVSDGKRDIALGTAMMARRKGGNTEGLVSASKQKKKKSRTITLRTNSS